MEYYYIKSFNYLVLNSELFSSEYCNIGTTYDDFLGGKFVRLSNEQWSFHVANPSANFKEVWDMQFHVRTLEEVKNEKIETIDEYDKSNAVNEVTLQGRTTWFDLKKREDVRQSLIALKYKNIDEFTYWDGLIPITLPVATFEYILNEVELYAVICFNVTAQHKYNVMSLETIEEVDAYDYTKGYPQKLSF